MKKKNKKYIHKTENQLLDEMMFGGEDKEKLFKYYVGELLLRFKDRLDKIEKCLNVLAEAKQIP